MTMPSLDTTLRLNAGFSLLTGAAAVVLGVVTDAPFGLAPWFLITLGLGLAIYGVQLAAGARDRDRLGAIGRFAIAADSLWVVGAAVVLLFFPDTLDGAGRVVLLVATVVVAELAITQYLGLRRLSASPAG